MSKFLVRKKPRDKYELDTASPPPSPAHQAITDYGSITSLLNNEVSSIVTSFLSLLRRDPPVFYVRISHP